MTGKQIANQKLFQNVALTVTAIGAVVSMYLMYNTGREQKSLLLIALFTGWVISPFIGLFILNKISI